MKLGRGAGIWTRAGALVHYDARAGDLAWGPGDGSLWALRATFEAGSSGVCHRIAKLDPVRFTVVRELVIDVPSGGPELLEISPGGRLAIASWREQNEWGYVGIDLEAGAQTELALRWRRGCRAAPPKFSADGSTIFACHSEGAAWWNHRDCDDPSEQPSEGGLCRVGWITTHDVASNIVRESEVIVELPPGWLPDDPYDSRWYQLYGPELADTGAVGVWMPDGGRERFALPLGARLRATRALEMVRVSE